MYRSSTVPGVVIKTPVFKQRNAFKDERYFGPVTLLEIVGTTDRSVVRWEYKYRKHRCERVTRMYVHMYADFFFFASFTKRITQRDYNEAPTICKVSQWKMILYTFNASSAYSPLWQLLPGPKIASSLQELNSEFLRASSLVTTLRAELFDSVSSRRRKERKFREQREIHRSFPS